MLDLIIFFFLAFGLLVGLKRGFILQVIYLTSAIIAFIVARTYYDDLAPKLKLWVPFPHLGEADPAFSFLTGDYLELAYYRTVAFVLLFFCAKIALHIIGSMLDFVALLPILKQVNRLLGAIFGFAETYLILFLVLFLGMLLPIEQVQGILGKSVLAELIVHHTPILSDRLQDLLINYLGNGNKL